MANSSRSTPLLRTVALLALATFSAGVAEIQSTLVAENLRDPMELAIAPNGDLIVIEREGRVLRVRPSTGGVFEMGTVPVTALRESDRNSPWAREDGLLGVALDPGFASNGRIFLYYSHPREMLNRLSRFVVTGGRLDLSPEKMLLEIATDRRDKVCHQGGSLAFGPDGLLYLSTGDNTNPFESGGFAPIDDRDGRDQATRCAAPATPTICAAKSCTFARLKAATKFRRATSSREARRRRARKSLSWAGGRMGGRFGGDFPC